MSFSSIHLEVLRTELTIDPLTRGYAGMTEQQVADSLNAVDRNNWVEINSARIFEAIDVTEFRALSVAERARIDRVLGLGEGLATAPGSKVRDEILAVFGGGSTTAANLIPIANPQQSRAREIGLPRVKVGDVTTARTL